MTPSKEPMNVREIAASIIGHQAANHLSWDKMQDFIEKALTEAHEAGVKAGKREEREACAKIVFESCDCVDAGSIHRQFDDCFAVRQIRARGEGA